LNAFEKNLHGAGEILRALEKDLGALRQKFSAPKLEKLLVKSRDLRTKVAKKLERGHDRLLELNSCKPGQAEELSRQIRALDSDEKFEEFLVRLFDQAFVVPGTKWRFGLDALFGLVPGLGDIAGALVAVYALRVARNLNAPPVIQLHLLTNIALDAVIGMVPVLGDLFDFAFKAQTRNLALLDAWTATPHKASRRSRRGLLLIPIAIIVVFATLTALGVWMLYLLFHWLAGAAAA
jgi:hypothetical protein